MSFAKNQKELMNKIDELSPDLIILDIILPQFNTAETLKKIQSKTSDSKPKVILVSSQHKDEQLSKYFRMGVQGYIKKPFSLQELEQKVRKQLQ